MLRIKFTVLAKNPKMNIWYPLLYPIMQFLCHMTSDVKFSPMFFLFILLLSIIKLHSKNWKNFDYWTNIDLLWNKRKTKRGLNWNETMKNIFINIFTGKRLWWCSFYDRHESLEFCKKRPLPQLLSSEIHEVLQNIVYF